jgi:hypothetical protein
VRPGGSLFASVAAFSLLVIMFARDRPDPERLMQAGRPLEACRLSQYEISFIRGRARWLPVLNAVIQRRHRGRIHRTIGTADVTAGPLAGH